jgi:acetolactate synthase-1/2/3 large subunit
MDSPEPLYAALGGGITPITVRDERCGAVMADAYARVSRRPGVCTGLHGCGATNLVQGVIEAWFASTPVVVLASELSRENKHKNELQDIDHTPFFSSITKWLARIESPERLSAMTARGFSMATSGRPGPVYLGYPSDVLSCEPAVVPTEASSPAEYPAYRVAPDAESVRRAAAVLAAARRPCVVAGGGGLISAATRELAALARVLKAPVATTPLGKGAFDEFDSRSAGVVGGYTGGLSGRGRIANSVVLQSDAVVLVGSKTDSVATADWTVPSPETTIIHIDIDPAEIGRNYPSSIPMVGDAKLALAALTTELEEHPAREEWALDSIAEATATWTEDVKGVTQSDSEPLRPERVMHEIAKVLDDDTIVTTDASYSSAWAMDLLRFRSPGRRFLAPRGYGSLGWGLPAAIGAKLPDPEKKVICITGDGGFGYVFQELETAARYGVPVVVVVLNNRVLGFQRHYERRFWNNDGETGLLDVDHALLAQALRCEGLRIETPDDLAGALSRARSSGRPTVIDVSVDETARPAITWFD